MLEKLKKSRTLRFAAICVVAYLVLGTGTMGTILLLLKERVTFGNFIRLALGWPMYLWYVVMNIFH